MKKTSYVLPLILAIILCSCGQISEYKGEVIESDKSISPFSQLSLKGTFELFLIQGDEVSLRFEGNEELIDEIVVDQKGQELKISLDGKGTRNFLKNEAKIFLTVTSLEKINFEGVGQIKSEGQLAFEKLEIKGEGVGNVELDLEVSELVTKLNFVGKMDLKGAADKFYLSNEGIGSINATNFIAEDVEVISSGIGSISVHSIGELSMEVNGIGSISYTGNPKVIKEDVNGLGSISRNE
ncbi:DUF2807 domain-containing protein [Belliella sp. DSM 107340]|uniref:DUF2807 domain-containing protein n=1 Tax=Belliella calami TaxID=2923436 RepID=A0ABS9UNH9_9BACT|nr:head GIN domain-containing protein [Belliella calami]MCH7398166.1 DUF2807 domain-containing protein [Belliella calami]